MTTNTVDKPTLILKADYYKGKEKMIEDAPSTRYVIARLGRLFKHEVVALLQKQELISRDWQALQRYYKFGALCSGLEPEEKPPSDGVHHKTRCCYQTINYNPIMVDSPSNRVCQRKIDIVVVFGRNFSFTIEIPNFMFTFIQQVNPLLKK